MTRRCALLFAFAVALGCSSPGDPPEDDGNNTVVEIDAGSCTGCVSDGECVPGDSAEACGGNGAMCEACADGEECAEGECVVPPSCDPSTCDGCCDGDTCVEDATSADACGSGGLACATCEGDAECTDGRCVQPCGPDNCEGCCDASGECVEGTADATCGKSGAACQACGNDESCQGGTCVGVECSESCDGCCSGPTCLGGESTDSCGMGGDACVDCGIARICEAGSCKVDPNSRWEVIVLSAEIAETDLNGSSWDAFGGLPDPYPIVEDATGKRMMPPLDPVIDTLTPTWALPSLSDARAEDLLERMTILIVDRDAFAIHDVTTACGVSLREVDFSGDTREIDCSEVPDENIPEGTVRFRLVPE